MRAMVVGRYGPPEVFEAREGPEPTPKPGEALIRVIAVGVGFADLMQRMGVYPGTPKPPFVPGFELAGVAKAYVATRRYHPMKLMQENTAIIGVHLGHLDARSAVLAKELDELFGSTAPAKSNRSSAKRLRSKRPQRLTGTSTAARTSARWCCVWPSRDGCLQAGLQGTRS